MKTYVLKRLIISVPLLFTMSFIVFLAIKLSPGDWFQQYERSPREDQRIIERQKREIGYYKPVTVQYLYWLRGLCFDVKTKCERTYIADFEERIVEEKYRPGGTLEPLLSQRGDHGYYAELTFSGSGGEHYQLNRFNNPRRADEGPWHEWPTDRFDRLELDLENLGTAPVRITATLLSGPPDAAPVEVAVTETFGPRRTSTLGTVGKHACVLAMVFAVIGTLVAVFGGAVSRKGLLVAGCVVAAAAGLYAVLAVTTSYNRTLSIDLDELANRGADLGHVRGLRISSEDAGTVLFDNVRLKERTRPRLFRWPNFGYSFATKQPVFERLWPRMVNTLKLSFFAILITWFVALPIGIYCAVHQYSIGDSIFAFFSFIGMSIPNFFFSLLLLYAVSLTFELPAGHALRGLFPIGGLTSENFSELSAIGKILDQAWHLVLPVSMTVMAGLAGLQRQMRGNLLEELRQLYVTTARAKGLPEHKVIYKHAVRNAINPMVTYLGYLLTALISSSALVEIIFAYPGVGKVMLEAVLNKDLYVVMGSMMLGGTLLLIGNVMADILLAVVDPRIRYD